MKKILLILTLAILGLTANQANSQILPSSGFFNNYGSGASPSVISAAPDTVVMYQKIQGSGPVTITTTLEATGTSPTITGVITLWVSLDGYFFFPHPDGGSVATTTLTTQAPTTGNPTTVYGTTTTMYVKNWTWTTNNPYVYYLVRVTCSALGGTSPTFTATTSYVVRKLSGN